MVTVQSAFTEDEGEEFLQEHAVKDLVVYSFTKRDLNKLYEVGA